MSELMPFQYGETSIRTIVINGEPWFALNDLCKALSIAQTRNVSARLADDQKDVRPMDTLGGVQQTTIVNESGMYEVVIRSDKPEAVKFRQWITGTVLPQIRKTGSFVSGKTQAELVTRADLARMVLESEEEKKVLEAALDSAAPAIAYHDRHIAENDDLITVKTWGAQFGLTEPQAYNLLKSKNIVYKLSFGERWSRSKGRKEEVFEYRARAGRVTFEWFEPRPQHNAPRHHNGQVKQTLYVKQFFADLLADKCGLQRQMTLGGDAA